MLSIASVVLNYNDLQHYGSRFTIPTNRSHRHRTASVPYVWSPTHQTRSGTTLVQWLHNTKPSETVVKWYYVSSLFPFRSSAFTTRCASCISSYDGRRSALGGAPVTRCTMR